MTRASEQTAAVLRHAEATMDQAIARWFALLRIPSVSAQPAHAADCARAAEWMRGELAEIGFRAEMRPTAGHACVVGHHDGPGGASPHLLFYGHYDVQPPEPLELWPSPPFEPTMVDGPHGKRVVARGAVDDKGQVATWLAALRAWQEVTGSLPVRASVLVEGEEEIGSPSLEPFLKANRAELKADVAVISDTGMWDIATPAITTRLRGLVYVQVTLKGPERDLHSGVYGGSALNPINALARILGELHDREGRIQVPGFYDRVRPVSAEQRREWERLGFDERAFLRGIGLSRPVGEAGVAALERLWARPTADINGIWGGYTGAGAKTVIPAEAGAKLSFRLVPDQDPEAILEGVKSFVASRLPPDARVTYEVFGLAPAIEVPSDSQWVRAARSALEDEFGRAPVLMGCGGSIPVVDSLRRIVGLGSLLVGFGLEDDQPHSPGEKFELRCFERGVRSHIRMLGKFAER
jgi:acetylornithine deacetylase/succinyl-diaminopimelate desuccinylase-like protein